MIASSLNATLKGYLHPDYHIAGFADKKYISILTNPDIVVLANIKYRILPHRIPLVILEFGNTPVGSGNQREEIRTFI